MGNNNSGQDAGQRSIEQGVINTIAQRFGDELGSSAKDIEAMMLALYKNGASLAESSGQKGPGYASCQQSKGVTPDLQTEGLNAYSKRGGGFVLS